jgi:hypothetical protein
MSSRHLQAMLLRLAGSFIAVVGVWAVLAWNPALCVVPAIGCASPLPGQTSSCVPPIPTCTNEYVPLRLGSALLSVAIGIALFVLAWRRDRDGAPQGTLRTGASGAF